MHNKVQVDFYFDNQIYAGRCTEGTPIPNVGDKIIVKDKSGTVVEVVLDYTFTGVYETTYVKVYTQ